MSKEVKKLKQSIFEADIPDNVKSISYTQNLYLLKTNDDILFIIDDKTCMITAIDISKANQDEYTNTTVHTSFAPDIAEDNKIVKHKIAMLYDCIIEDRKKNA